MTKSANRVIAELQAKIEALEAMLGDRQAQIDQLTASAAQFRAIADHACDTICTLNAAGELTYISPNVQDSIGYTPAALVGQSFAPLVHPDDLSRCHQALHQVLATAQPCPSLEYRIRHQQGHYVWHQASLAAYQDQGGAWVIVAIGRDATHQKQTEVALAKSQAQLEAILQNANVAIFAKDLEGRYIFANSWVSREVGLSAEEILGKTDAELLPPAIAERLQHNDRIALETGQALRTEEVIASPGGDHAYLAIKFPLCDRDGTPYAVCGISTNITDLKRTEAALRTSEARLSRILDRSLACIADYRVYRDRRFIAEYFSSGSLQLWGFTPEELLNDLQLYMSRYEPEDLQTIVDQSFDYIFNEQPYRYEYRYHHPDGSLRWIELNLNSYRDNQEDYWRTTVISIDITDRKRAEEALRYSEAKLNQILDSTMASIGRYRIYANFDWEPEYFSLGTTEIWGFSPDELLDDKMLQFDRVHPEDMDAIIYPQVYPAIFAEQTILFEYRYFHPHKQEWRWIAQTVNSVRDDAADCWLATVIATDITDRKRAEAAFRESEAKLNRILDRITACIADFRVYPDRRFVGDYFSPGSVQLWGLTPEELLADLQPWISRYHPDDLAISLTEAFDYIFNEQPYTYEYRYHHPDGSLRWIQLSLTSYWDESEGCWWTPTLSIDITDRKRAEIALARSEAQFRRIVENASDLIITATPDGIMTYVSPIVSDRLGYTPDELIGTHFAPLVHPDDLPIVAHFMEKIITTGESCEFEHRDLHRDGSVRYVVVNVSQYEDENGNLMLLAVIKDVTDRKRLEEELRRSETQFRRIVENASDLIITTTADGIITYVSPIIRDRLGYTPAELIGTHFAPLVYPEDLPMVARVVEQIITTGEGCEFEHRDLHRDGSVRYVVVNVSQYEDENGNLMLLGVTKDITERKHLEEELRRSEMKFRRIVENANDIIATVNADGILTYLSPNYVRIIERDNEDVIGASFEPLVHPEDIPRCYTHMQQLLTTQEPQTFEYRLLHGQGSYRHFVAVISLVYDDQNCPLILGISRDVTEQKRLEAELRQSEAKFRRIVENASDLIATVTPDGIITYISPVSLDLMGYPSAELLGQHFSRVMHPDDIAIAAAVIQQVMTAGEPQSFEHRIVHCDGSLRSVVANVAMYQDENGNPMLIGISRDMTEQKRLEAEVRRSETRFRLIVENANDTIATVTPEGTITYLSPNFLTLIGKDAAAVIGTSFESLVHPDDLPQCYESMRATTAGENCVLEYRVRDRTGQYRHFISNSSLFHDENGNPMILGISRDVTQQKQLEAELRQSELKFRTIVEQANDIIYTIDARGMTTYVSPNIQTTLGIPNDEFIDHYCDIRVHPDDIEMVTIAIQKTLAGENTTLECRAIHQDGSIRWLNSNLAPIQDANGEFQIMGIARDLSDRKRLEEELRQSEYKFRAIVENANDLIYVIDAKGKIIYMSPNSTVIYGFSPEEMQGLSFNRFVHPDDLASGADAIQRAIAGERFSFEVRSFHKDGSLRWFGSNISPYRMPNGEIGIMGIGRDITDRKRLEEELRQSQQFLNSVIDNIPMGFFAKDARDDFRYVLINRCAERFVGFSREMGVGRTDRELLSPAEAAFYRQQDEAVLRLRSLIETPELEMESATGDRLLARILKFPLVDDQGTLTHVLCLTDDITERKQREEELRLAKDAAEAANRSKSTFLANMSHELRTPLNVILGFTQLMERDTSLSDRQRQYITTINRSGEHLLNLINDVLEMSKIEAGRITLHPEPFDLGYLLDTLQEMFRVRAEAKQIGLDFVQLSSLPPAIIADAGKLRQVLINLLSNAVKFTEQGQITLQVEMDMQHQQTQDTTSLMMTALLRFRIADTGIGIAPHEIEQLFQPFVQTASGLQVKEGTGLGLTISRQFVQLMGGEITVESVVGQGSTFCFQIPVTLAIAPNSSALTRSQPVLGLAPDQPTYRLLIVDDRLDNRTLLTHLLQPLGFETQTASNGQEAIAVWQTWQPHLIWMDMRMPILDGYDATRQIRDLERSQGVVDTPTKIIALTASAFEEQRATVLASGCDDFVRKPFREQVIFDKLTEHLGVQFLYGQAVESSEAEAAPVLQPRALQAMPALWLQDLHQAAIAIDSDRLLQLVTEIPPEQEALAQALANLIERFEFDAILDLLGDLAENQGESRDRHV